MDEWLEFLFFMIVMIIVSFLLTGVLYLGILWLLENPDVSDVVISYGLLISIFRRLLLGKKDEKQVDINW